VILRRRDEVGDHDHVAPIASECAVRLISQELRDRGHSIRLLDRELGEREVRRVLPHQCDIGAVQRGHDLQILLPFEHLLREPRRRGMRNGVMHVHDVELFAHRHFVLLHR